MKYSHPAEVTSGVPQVTMLATGGSYPFISQMTNTDFILHQ